MKDELHINWMRHAIAEAKKAASMGEVPIGAIAVAGDEIVMSAHNIRESTANPLGHAEILLLDALAKKRGTWRLTDVTVYVTCEPCLMCAGALLQARVPRLVYGCSNLETGSCGSVYNIFEDQNVVRLINVQGGVLQNECRDLLTDFFRLKRQ